MDKLMKTQELHVMECFESCLYISNKTALANIE